MKNKNQKQFRNYVISDEDYKEKDYIADKAYSVFSTLDILNKNNDLFKHTKNTTVTALKTIFNAQQLEDLLAKTNNTKLEVLANQVEKALAGKSNDVTLNAIASSVKEFLKKVENNKANENDDVNFDKNNLQSTVEKRASGPHNLVNQVSLVYGENRYVKENIKTETLQMTPLFVKFDNNTEAISKTSEISQHIKSAYNYNIIYSTQPNPINVFKRNIRVERYNGAMDSCVNMLYSVAKTFVGSKKIGLKQARNMLFKGEHNDYLNAKGLIKKYEDEKVSSIFKSQKSTIKDVVATLTTIFMARFVFEAPKFAEIERDLTEQACAKMRTLRISSNPNEDYWINQLIEDRLKLNIAQVLSANNIHDAKDLLEIYNKNGTTIVNADKITNLEDLVFAVQYNNPESVENKKLEHVKEGLAKYVKPSLKKIAKIKKQKSNKFLDEVIRTSDLYKKYYEEYMEKFKLIELDEQKLTGLKQEKEKIDNELNDTDKLTQSTQITEEEKDKIAKKTAKSDAIGTILALNEEDDDIDEESELEDKENSDEEVVDNQKNEQKDADEIKNENKQDDKESDSNENNVQEKNEEANKDSQTLNEDEKDSKQVVFKTAKDVQDLKDETVLKRVKKYYEKIAYGQNGKVGVIGDLLNYRVIEKTKSKSNFSSDGERLDDKDLNMANKIRDKKVGEVIESFSNATYDYYTNFKGHFKNLTIPKLCSHVMKVNLNLDDTSKFTKSDIAKLMSVVITKQVNEELKEHNIELYTGKKTYKKYEKISEMMEETK